MKTCAVCGIEKELTEFHRNSQKTDGLCNKCKDCRNKQQDEYYRQNKEEILQKQKEYSKENKEKINKYQNEYRKENREKNIKYAKKYRQENKFKRNEYQKNRRKNDLIFKLQQNLRNMANNAIKKGYKSASTQELLGCTWEEVIIHIENQFQEGMTWDNWTKDGWHIDHIKPIAAFTDLTDPEQQRQCCHYTNFRPMWAEENYSKSSWYNEIKYSKKK